MIAATCRPTSNLPAQRADGGGHTPELTREQIERLERRYGNRYLLEPAPDHKLPKIGHDRQGSAGLDRKGDGARRHPDAQSGDVRDHLDGARGRPHHRGKRCTRTSSTTPSTRRPPRSSSAASACSPTCSTLPGETTGARTQGSSEAIMLGALSLKWKWRARREAAGKATDRPNLVFGGDVHVVLGEVLPLLRGRAADRPAGARQVHDRPRGRGAAHRREHDRRRRGARHDLHRALRRHPRDQRRAASRSSTSGAWTCPLHVDAASGRLRVAVPLPDSEWDFRLEQVRSINVSGHKFGLVYPGIGWLVFREASDLAEDLVFYKNYLGKRDADVHPELLHRLRDGARAVLQLRAPRPRVATATSWRR